MLTRQSIKLLTFGHTHLFGLLSRLHRAGGFDKLTLLLKLSAQSRELGLYNLLLRSKKALDQWMLSIEYHVVAFGKLTIEVHTRLQTSHLLHTAHELPLRDQHGISISTKCFEAHAIVALLLTRQAPFKEGLQGLLLYIGETDSTLLILSDKLIDRVRVYSYEARLLELLLQLRYRMDIQRTI